MPTSNLDTDVDALFRLPLAEFTGARNALAARLKKSGRAEEKADAARVKALAKPSISAWAVNQLYWNHRDAFDQLIASGERFHKAQTSRSAGKAADMRTALDTRRESLTHLTALATSLLRDGGQNPALDTIRRITTTLEALSAYAQRSDAPQAGRLTADVDPPGFELFGGSVPGMRSLPSAGAGGSTSAKRKQTYPLATAGGTGPGVTKTRRKVSMNDDVRQLAEMRKAKIAAAKVSLQDAKRSLTEARARAQTLEAAQKRADTEAKKAEKQKLDAEVSLDRATAASRDAARRARSVESELKEAAKDVLDAERTVAEASKELEKVFGE